MKGIWAAALTPVGEDLAPDSVRAVPYYRRLLERGCDGINLLGTTGEAMSFSAGQRATFMESVASSDLPKNQMIAATGGASLDDAVRLTKTAFECGFAAALIMPPFFFREATDDGIVAFFEALATRTAPPRGGILLYNFPRMSGVAFHAGLVDRLLGEFPGIIGGVKDSSNDAALQSDIIGRHPDLRVFPGSERDLLAAKARGAAGCISGSVALWPELARQAWTSGEATLADELTRRRAALDGLPFIPAVRRLTADFCGEAEWERAMPPNVPLTPKERRLLAQRISR